MRRRPQIRGSSLDPVPAFLRELSRDTGLCWARHHPPVRRQPSTAQIPGFVHEKKFPAIKCRLRAGSLSQPRSVLLVAGFAKKRFRLVLLDCVAMASV